MSGEGRMRGPQCRQIQAQRRLAQSLAETALRVDTRIHPPPPYPPVSVRVSAPRCPSAASPPPGVLRRAASASMRVRAPDLFEIVFEIVFDCKHEGSGGKICGEVVSECVKELYVQKHRESFATAGYWSEGLE